MSTAVPPAPRHVPAPPSDFIADEQQAIARNTRLRKLIWVQAWAIAGLIVALMVMLPLSQPVYYYYALNPDKQLLQMVGLNMPNMTNNAILSWAVNSISEIMTMGFGDMDVRLPQQRWRFTDEGWEAFKTAFVKQKIGQGFKKSELVLTTTPSNTPVIVSQGVNINNVYEWNLQLPVIMTYATNNNKTVIEDALVALTIVRVPADESSAGIAIEQWGIKSVNLR